MFHHVASQSSVEVIVEIPLETNYTCIQDLCVIELIQLRTLEDPEVVQNRTV